jgi:fatty-acyl-CoA synthase
MGNRHFEFWPPKVPRQLTLPQTSLWVNLEISAKRYPDKPCTVFYDSVLSYASFQQQAEKLAGYLQQECGVKRGDRVGIYMQNCPQFMVAFYAVLRADAVVVPINPMNVTAELAYMLQDSGARVLFAAQERFSQIEPLLDDGVGHDAQCRQLERRFAGWRGSTRARSEPRRSVRHALYVRDHRAPEGLHA